MTILDYLQTAITENMQLPELIDIFEKMCQMPIDAEEEMLLYETGTYSFTGERLFYFSLVRQFPNESDEFYQLHLNVMYNPNGKNQAFSESIWNVEVDEDFFAFVKKSDAYLSVKNDEIAKVSVYMDET